MSRKLREKTDALLARERGTVMKPRGAEVAVALAYPNTYHVGMSNLGVHQIYSILNSRPDTARLLDCSPAGISSTVTSYSAACSTASSWSPAALSTGR